MHAQKFSAFRVVAPAPRAGQTSRGPPDFYAHKAVRLVPRKPMISGGALSTVSLALSKRSIQKNSIDLDLWALGKDFFNAVG